jgi:hypothetical protein
MQILFPGYRVYSDCSCMEQQEQDHLLVARAMERLWRRLIEVRGATSESLAYHQHWIAEVKRLSAPSHNVVKK